MDLPLPEGQGNHYIPPELHRRIMTTTARATARILADAGIDRVFGLPGGEVLVLIDELRRAGVEFVLMRHEANAGIAAAVYGKLRRQPGVVLTTLGPGAANLMLPLSSAYLDQEPLLALSAQLPEDFPRSHTHQLLPLHELYRPITRLSASITASDTAVITGAMERCLERPFGAAFLTLSAREALKPAPDGSVASAKRVTVPTVTGRESATRLAAEGLSEALRRAERPLVLVGLGFDNTNAEPLRRWLSEWKLPVAVTPKMKGVVDETSGNFVGVVGGMAADQLMCDALRSADLLVGMGLDPVEIDAQPVRRRAPGDDAPARVDAANLDPGGGEPYGLETAPAAIRSAEGEPDQQHVEAEKAEHGPGAGAQERDAGRERSQRQRRHQHHEALRPEAAVGPQHGVEIHGFGRGRGRHGNPI